MRHRRLSTLNDRLARGTAAFFRVAWPWTTYGTGLAARDALRATCATSSARAATARATDALGLLMAARDEHGEALSEDELLEQAVILMFAGHETTTSMLTLVPAGAARSSRRRTIASSPSSAASSATARSALDHLRELADLDLVLKEVERLWPPISLCQRGVVAPTSTSTATPARPERW